MIDATAVYVALDGAELEDAVKEREFNNEDFGFLFDEGSADHTYYAWRVWSLANGDTLTNWRREPFLMTRDGSLWIPPPITPSTVSSVSTVSTPTETTMEMPSAAPARIAMGKKPLSSASRRVLARLLESLSDDRRSIASLMSFAIEHAECCVEVSGALAKMASAHDAGHRLAAILAISDILYNTTSRVPNASLYRVSLQSILPGVFASLLSSPSCSTSRLGRAAVVDKLRALVEVWGSWNVLDEEVLEELTKLTYHGL